MNDIEREIYNSLVRITDLPADIKADFPAATTGGQLLAQIAAGAATLSEHDAAQTSGAGGRRQGFAKKSVARTHLRELMLPIARTARVLAFDNAGLDGKFQVPASRDDSKLLAAARAFASDAAPLEAEFVKYELPADFLDELNDAVTDFEQATNETNTATGTQVSATSAIDDTLKTAMRARVKLDAIARNKYRGSAPKLAAWSSAFHIERAARKPKSETPK